MLHGNNYTFSIIPAKGQRGGSEREPLSRSDDRGAYDGLVWGVAVGEYSGAEGVDHSGGAEEASSSGKSRGRGSWGTTISKIDIIIM